MGILVVWEKPHKHVLHVVYRPQWNEQHFVAALFKARTMLNQVDYPVDLIIDQEQMILPPQDFLLHAQRLTTITRHRNTARVILIGVPQTFWSLCEIAAQNNTPFHNYHFSPTMEDAVEILWESAVV